MSEGFAEFYAAHYERIAGQLYAYLGDEAEAQDVTQEAFCRALDRWKKVSAYDNPAAFVRQVAWNLATSRLRHLQVALRHAIRQRPQHVEGPNPDRIVLVNALAALPANHRMALVLHHIGDLSTSEIAEQRGVAEGTVRSWLSRGRSQLAEELSDWRPRFVPPGVEAAKTVVRRRRAARRSALAGLVLLALLGFAAAVVRFGGGEPPIIGPTPTPTESSSGRRVSLPGVDPAGPTVSVQFVDGRHAWAISGACEQGGQSQCRYAMSVTDDTAATWRRVALPAEVENKPIEGTLELEAVDMWTAMLTHLRRPGDVTAVWVTRDGGVSYQRYAGHEFSLEMATSIRGGLDMRCAGYGTSELCPRFEIVDSATGVTVPVPPFIQGRPGLSRGADGRFWLLGEDRLAVSDDAGRNWREVPWPERGESLHLGKVDGRPWVTGPGDGGTAFWEFDGAAWHLRATLEPAPDQHVPLLLDGGVWLVQRGAGLFYLKDGKLSEIPQLAGTRAMRVLEDGSVEARAEDGSVWIGTGPGTERTWIRIES